MFDELISIFETDISSWISEVVGIFTTNHQVSEGVYEETIANVPWSALIPWSQIFAFTIVIVFMILIFKLLRSVLCKAL